MEIQWYPGHMVKSKKIFEDNIKMVNVVIELVDARIPESSKNPEFDKLIKNKSRIIVLNKSDLADPSQTKKWLNHYKNLGFKCVAVNSLKGQGVSTVKNILSNLEVNNKVQKIIKITRVMVIGIPNVGKSAFINKLAGRNSAKTGDKPGITRGKQWIKIKSGIELLDIPGVLWPKFVGDKVGFKLAAINAIGENAYDRIDLAKNIIDMLKESYNKKLKERYKLTNITDLNSMEILNEIALKRGCYNKGKEANIDSAASIFIKEFRNGIITRITMDRLNENE